ncbi:putative target SNARE [Trypanosoma rangeli]|uniref:Putative target SNARE n=1 Tax=Trypanosoma rangeli TaxID=5698 RepID=A0A3R7KBK5_TRYRA|nr:putative target SNARE [Trypanosoma rangeli]RNF03245.1 putative target SNARE [Trypanosoma rangeli]|eukprot:RNF03245.1 putative target SNARE [Trypanosoma rangeli]
MLRSCLHDVTCWGRRFISIGGRRTRGGFSQPIGKQPQVKQGKTEGVPRRIPGTTKVTYTNKKGRTFTFSVPVAELTHPQDNMTNSLGGWKEIDTSFVDVGDMEDDMPSPVDECLQKPIDAASIHELHEAFVSLCKEYVLMDTTGMKNMPCYGELNVGPDYEHYDRRVKRKRHWLAIRHRFEEVRRILWPDEEAEAREPPHGAQLSVGQMLDALRWVEAASTFCVRKVHPADVMNAEEFLPLDLHREVAIVACRARGDPRLFSLSSNALELFVACAALCVNHKVPFSLFFASGDDDTDGITVGDGDCILMNMPFVHTTLGAIRIMSLLGGDSNAYVFSNMAGVVERRDIFQGLLRLMSVEVFGGRDALENVGEDEICIIMHFCVEVKERNAAFFARDTTDNEEEVSFKAKYGQVSQIALARCKYLLYRLDGPQTRIMSEEGYIPLVDLQQHAERTNKETVVHYNLGIRSAQGLRRVALGAQSSARLAELVDRLESQNVRVSGNTLLVDLVQHLSHKAAASKVSLTLKEVNTLLPLLARMQSETPTKQLNSRFDRLFNVMETAIGTAMQQDHSVEEIVELVEGLAACNFVPSSFKQVEMVLMRLMMTQACGLSQIIGILTSLSTLMNSAVSQVLLQTAASHAVAYVKLQSVKDGDVDQLVKLLEALASCRYAALPGLVVHCREECFSAVRSFSLDQQCGYASLLASAATGMQDENKSLSQQLSNDSRRHFIEYTRNAQGDNLARFVDCVMGLAAVGLGDTAEDEEIHSVLVSFLCRSCLTLESCTAMSTTTLATLLEGILLWCAALRVPPKEFVAPLEDTLFMRIRDCNNAGETLDFSEELAEVVCRVVGLQLASDGLREAAAQALGRAILRAESTPEARKPAAREDRSFEVMALVNAEQESNHVNTVLRYCAALHRSGMSHIVEELMA